jgi:hypothetical protein
MRPVLEGQGVAVALERCDEAPISKNWIEGRHSGRPRQKICRRRQGMHRVMLPVLPPFQKDHRVERLVVVANAGLLG